MENWIIHILSIYKYDVVREFEFVALLTKNELFIYIVPITIDFSSTT